MPTAIVQAAFDGDVDAVRAWLAAGGAVDEFHGDVNHLAVGLRLFAPLIDIAIHSRLNSPELIKILLEAGARYQSRYLMGAIRIGNLGAVQLFLPHADVNEPYGNWTVLHFAAFGGSKGKD